MADIAGLLNELAGALDGLAAQVMSVVGEDRSFMEIWAWNLPGMNRLDLADYIMVPKLIIQKIDPSEISAADVERIAAFPARIQFIRANVVQNLPGGNATNAVVAISGMVDSLTALLEKYNQRPLDLEALESRKLLPASQLRELRSIAKGIERLTVESGLVDSKIDEIISAHAIAEALPADLQTLEDARKRYEEAERRLTESTGAVNKAQVDVEKLFQRFQEVEIEAGRILQNANRAYSASTTVGLGAAFADRARTLSQSTWILGFVLLLTLATGGVITYNRVEFVHKLMTTPNVNFNILWINVTFTALSVSAPVWLAWLLTRQIGQRFRLSEDYGYKSAIAKAYEGYRNEAAQIDDALVQRLFSIALDVLGEAPLRLVEKDSPGSPIHEMRGSFGKIFRRPAASTDSDKSSSKMAEQDERNG